MVGQRFVRALVAALLSVALVAACGDDGEDSADTTVADDDGGDTGGDGDGGGDGVDGAAIFGDDDCRVLATIGVAYAAAFVPGPSEELAQARAFFGDLDDVPDEIADDVATVAAFFAAVGDAFEDAGIDTDDPNVDYTDPEFIAKYQQAVAAIQAGSDEEAFQAANDDISEWAQENCNPAAIN
jgi:hypothetical protein